MTPPIGSARSGIVGSKVGIPIPPSGISRYKFENDVTDSWGSNDGTDNTSAGYVTGVYGSAKDFDGADDYVELPDFGLSSSQSFTITGWINKNDSDAHTILGAYDGSDDILTLGFDGGGKQWSFSAGHVGGTRFDLVSNTATGDGVWTQLTATYDSSGPTAKLYVNGTQSDLNTLSIDDFATPDGPNIGRRSDGVQHTNGSIDDVRIYDKPLSDSEVSNLYNTGSIDG